MNKRPVVLVSACLLGLCTRYDGQQKISKACLQETADMIKIPICPEQLGGLATPREAADIVGGDGHEVLAGTARVMTKSGQDVTRQFILGAQQTLAIARLQQVDAVYLKARSPSCAVSGKTGVAAALLSQHGYILHEF